MPAAFRAFLPSRFGEGAGEGFFERTYQCKRYSDNLNGVQPTGIDRPFPTSMRG
jgi:hypothetical protein